VTCPLCADRGLVRVRYHDGAVDDFGICLCLAGQRYRSDPNVGYPMWQLWAAREQVDLAHVWMVEDLLDEAELASVPRGQATTTAPTIAGVMRTKRPRR
jgi:hypothetical protein